ncbi:CPBP family intramembrane glutamic endopeptidase [Salimicrobium flavidum]|uniref:CAAX protease self-immunity n=1 Tax=Salimicrobium flavidum TaxID=570947 RepID=A0A1N7JJ85_9BACI|nr:CPBP family intramembrane glutamic endopeptidase [Salimicrobium flavidum]SIS49387.1 CAAX protease self-immunity [Salimicrobium flavidum]
MPRTDLKISLILAVLSFIAGFVIVPYQLQTMPEIRESLPVSVPVLSLVSSGQLFVMVFLLSFAGCKFARRTDLSLPFFRSLVSEESFHPNRRGALRSVVIGMFVAFLIVASDRFYFQNHIPYLQDHPPEFSILALTAGVLYGGIVEEALLRLFFMSALVFAGSFLFKKKPRGLYWSAILIAALLFAAGHLPATATLFDGLTTMSIVRSFLLNGTGGVFFGYLFWRYGLIYAIVAHMLTHVFMQLLFIPLFY